MLLPTNPKELSNLNLELAHSLLHTAWEALGKDKKFNNYEAQHLLEYHTKVVGELKQRKMSHTTTLI